MNRIDKITERYMEVTKVSKPTQPINNKNVWVVLLSGDVTSKTKETFKYFTQISMQYATKEEALKVKVGDKVNY